MSGGLVGYILASRGALAGRVTYWSIGWMSGGWWVTYVQ